MDINNRVQHKLSLPAPAAAFQAAAVIGCAAASDTLQKPGSFAMD